MINKFVNLSHISLVLLDLIQYPFLFEPNLSSLCTISTVKLLSLSYVVRYEVIGKGLLEGFNLSALVCWRFLLNVEGAPQSVKKLDSLKVLLIDLGQVLS